MQVALVGGGKASLVLLDTFAAMAGYDVVYICDINPDAPGLIEAQKRNIPVCNNLTELAGKQYIDLVFEITGSNAVYNELQSILDSRQTLVRADTGKLVFDIIEQHESSWTNREKVISAEFARFVSSFTTSLGHIRNSQDELGQMLKKMNIITVNGRVEAARAGESGLPFAVVVDELSSMIDQVKGSLKYMDDALTQVKTSIGEVESARQRLSE